MDAVRSEELCRRMLESANAAIIVVDCEHRITHVNGYIAAMLGYEPGEMQGVPVSDFMFPEELSDHHSRMAERMEGRSGSYERCFRRKDGTECRCYVSGTPLKDDRGRVIGSFAVLCDVTEAKRCTSVLEAGMRLSRLAEKVSLDELLQAFLDEAKRLTGSRTGWFQFMDADRTTATLRTGPTQDRCDSVQGDGTGRRYPLEPAGVLADCVHGRRPVIRNSGLSAEHHQGLPPGPSLSRELAFPIVRDDLVAAILCMGNKESEYDDRDVAVVSDLSNIAWDIVVRKQAEEKLRESEARFRSLFGNSLDAIFLTNPEGRILAANRAACAMFGMTEEELIEAGREGVVDVTDSRLAEALEERSRTGRFFGELNCVRGSGAGFPAEVSSVLMEESPGSFVMIRDISHRKKSEQELRDSEERYRRLFEMESDAVLLVDMETGCFMDANPAAQRMYGYTPEEFRNLTPEDLSTEPDKTASAIAAGQSQVPHRLHRKKDGTVFPVEISASYFENGGRKVHAAAIRDISDSKRAESALLRANAYNRSLIEASMDPLVTIGPDGKITDVNAATEDATGYRRDELIGTDFCDYFTDPPSARDGYRQVFRDGQVRDYPLEMRHREGQTTPVLYNASLYRDENGEVIGVFAAARDITGQKEAEKALRDSLQEKEVLLREVHHRVKNNLAAVIGLMEMQRKGTRDMAASAALHDLCSRIKAMSFVHERLYRSDNLSRIDFDEYLKGLISHLRISYGTRHDIGCDVDAAGVQLGLDLAVPCALIISELLTNAFKYAFPRNAPLLAAQKCQVEVYVEQQGDEYRIIVADNGVGMPPGFDWGSSSSLGLRLVRMLGEHQLGGRVLLDVSRGTRFELTFKSSRWRVSHAG